jgi:putative ABC transport system permease protein
VGASGITRLVALSTFARLGLRNLARRRGRTALTVLMIAGGTMLSVFSIGVGDGTYDMMKDLATRSSVGHLQVQRAGYDDKPGMNKTVRDPAQAQAALAAHPAVSGATLRVVGGGLFAKANRTTAAALFGVDPAQEGRVTTIPKTVSRGAWLPAQVGPDDPLPIVVSAALLRQLKADLGDEISFLSQAADGSMAAELYVIGGIVGEEDGPGATAPLAYIRLSDAQELFALGTRVHQVVAVLDDISQAGAVAADLSLAPGDVGLSWDALLPSLAQSIESDQAGGRIFLVIILFVVLLGVTNTMLMAVFERTREFGVLMALGTTPRQIIGMTLAEAFWLSAFAAGLGGLVGVIINLIIGEAGIPLGSYSVDFGGVFIDRMPAVNNATVLMVPLIVMVCGVLAAVFPAWRASRLDPTQALRG